MSILEHFAVFKRSPKSGNLNKNIVGGSLIGVGMALSGACPGTVWVQVGTGVRSSYHVLGGAMIGTVVYAYLSSGNLLPSLFNQHSSKEMLDKSKGFPARYTTIGVFTAAITISAMMLLNMVFPWEQDLQTVIPWFTSGNLSFTSLAWSPIIGGLCVASVQTLNLILGGSPLGLSSSFVEIVEKVVPKDAKKSQFSYLSNYEGYETMLLALGVAGGGALSAYLSGAKDVISSLPGPSALRSVLGGISLLFGARLANGCTSGHGISGIAQLSVLSIVTVAAMFGAGIATAAVLP